jgi:hypothetical protein
MIPKNDLRTNSVEAAEAYEQWMAKKEMKETDDFDWNEYFAKQNDEDECNCSDPHCPCGGNKRGY